MIKCTLRHKIMYNYYQELMSRQKGGGSVQLHTIEWNGI